MCVENQESDKFPKTEKDKKTLQVFNFLHLELHSNTVISSPMDSSSVSAFSPGKFFHSMNFRICTKCKGSLWSLTKIYLDFMFFLYFKAFISQKIEFSIRKQRIQRCQLL